MRKLFSPERGRGVKVQIWPHILSKNNASHRIEKTADLPQATHKFYHIMLNQVHLTKGRIRTGGFT
jgi:hypothetical protein